MIENLHFARYIHRHADSFAVPFAACCPTLESCGLGVELARITRTGHNVSLNSTYGCSPEAREALREWDTWNCHDPWPTIVED